MALNNLTEKTKLSNPVSNPPVILFLEYIRHALTPSFSCIRQLGSENVAAAH